MQYASNFPVIGILEKSVGNVDVFSQDSSFIQKNCKVPANHFTIVVSPKATVSVTRYNCKYSLQTMNETLISDL